MSTRRLLALSPVNITFVYLGFGILWIATTDSAVVLFVADPDVAAFLQTIKGWVFVALSAGLIFGLTRVRERRLEQSEQRLRTATEQIQVLHRVLRHNIRNDVNVIHGYVDMVYDELDTSESKAKLDHALERSRRIATMSDKIRILGELDITDETYGTVDLVRVTERCLEEASFEDTPDITVTSTVPERAPVQATPAIRHGIEELLENAIEHADGADDAVRLTIEIRRTNGEIELVIADDGPGIPPHELAPLEAESESELRHMSGVGLWIAKWVCEVHDGTIDVETGNDGTSATLRFHAATEPVSVEAAIERARESLPDSAPVPA
ncbi:Signal transduction histidine kinase, contains PAS domain [Halalkaliarchaeum sp. AArc-CO]|uniref:sensor histidine kinase n=1 Tax=Halalkaliarchaeum sp. AArc-CO TaxID=2866381 RepID=UPI00217CDF99|nr:HAMP domain-containing sensor histidine kinase [Halalkaliarchaeum sp. AArc-CO]UWG51766.1 Signal transduction histidine kinase, contains PAS domain [Halalkaliarchaeum sp. AArc-CO]